MAFDWAEQCDYKKQTLPQSTITMKKNPPAGFAYIGWLDTANGENNLAGNLFLDETK